MSDFFLKIIEGDVLDALKTLPDESVNLIVTSPPYWGLRDYGVEGQIGLELTLDEYLDKLLKVTAELKRVLRKDGILFWNHGDNYVNKCMSLQNYRLAIKMIDEQGWILRNVVIWYKPNHMPESAKDRFTNAYEPVFMFVKSKKYWSDLDAVREPHKWAEKDKRSKQGRWVSNNSKYTKNGIYEQFVGYHPIGKNPGDVWEIPTQPFKDVHFATFPEKLVERMVKFGCPKWICKKCGKPRERIVERNKIVRLRRNPVTMPCPERGRSPNDYAGLEIKTIGWTDCGCNAGWRPGVVLDPFMGSGTTLKVAREHGCSAIGIELNPEYVKMAKNRVNWGVGLDVEFIYERV